MTTLTRWTFPALLLGLTLTATAQEEAQLFDQLDKDSDGLVDREEFAEFRRD